MAEGGEQNAIGAAGFATIHLTDKRPCSDVAHGGPERVGDSDTICEFSRTHSRKRPSDAGGAVGVPGAGPRGGEWRCGRRRFVIACLPVWRGAVRQHGTSGHPLRSFCLTNPGAYGSLYTWSFYGHIVVGGSPRPARRLVWLASPGTHQNREMEIDQELYERSHYLIENTGSGFENELKTNSK